MAKRPFFSDPAAHADGPGVRFGVKARAEWGTPQQRRTRHAPAAGVLPALQSLLYVLVVALFLIAFTVQPIRIPSGSMEPTLLVGDFLLLNKESAAVNAGGVLPPTRIERGDVVVFHDPVDDPGVHLIKRVIGVPGDRLHLRNGIVFLNGRVLAEPYAVHRSPPVDTFRDDFPSLEQMDPGVNPAWWSRLRELVRGGEITIPAGEYFVMGDNRENSEDSRYWGFVPRDAIVGKPVMIYFSWVEPDRSGNAGPTDFARWDRTFRVVR